MMNPREQNLVPGQNELVRRLQFMPELGAENARERDDRDDVERIGLDAEAREIALQHHRRAYRSEPKQQAKGARSDRTNGEMS